MSDSEHDESPPAAESSSAPAADSRESKMAALRKRMVRGRA